MLTATMMIKSTVIVLTASFIAVSFEKPTNNETTAEVFEHKNADALLSLDEDVEEMTRIALPSFGNDNDETVEKNRIFVFDGKMPRTVSFQGKIEQNNEVDTPRIRLESWATTTTSVPDDNTIKCGRQPPLPPPAEEHYLQNYYTDENYFFERFEANGDDMYEKSEDRIVGGEVATIDNWPWQVSIRRLGQHICGGTLINAYFVLTAAHCFDGYRMPRLYTVFMSKSRTDQDEEGEVYRRVWKIIIHGQYNKTKQYDNDVALVKMLRPIKYASNVVPICMPKQQLDEPRFPQDCYVTGFGETLGTGYDYMLKRLKVDIIGDGICRNLNSKVAESLTENMFCAGAQQLRGGADACVGDSGGPLVCKFGNNNYDNSTTFVQYGIVSFGWGCGEANLPGIYVNLALYIKWIVANINK